MGESIDDRDTVSGAQVRAAKEQILLAVHEACLPLRIRMLAAGGDVFVARGLITPVVSPVLSLIVDPASVRHLVEQLARLGWWRMPGVGGLLPSGVVRLQHPDFVAGLRLYSVITGFFADPEETFDVLWERREHLAVRGVVVPSLDRISTAIFATHDGLEGRIPAAKSHFDFYVTQFRAALSADERTELGMLVRRVGGVEEMRPLLTALDIEPGPFVLPSAAYASWRLDADTVSDQVRWLLAFIEVRPGRRRELMSLAAAVSRSPRQVWASLVAAPVTLRLILRARRASRRASRRAG
jgi:hypothetical protein